MKLTVALLLSVALCHAAEVKTSSRSEQKSEVDKTEKRALIEGNAGVQKRVAVSVSPSPGIEYVDTKENHQDKSPAQQIYATPVPQVAKFSDVLTGHGIQFPAAIASHLYSPVSVYQPKLGSPTTYEVSAPVPSQLAYSEHKIYQPQQNAITFYNQPQKLQNQPKQNARLINYNQQQEQQVYQPQLIYQHQIPAQQQQPVYYNNPPQIYTQQPQIYNQQPLLYNQQPQIHNQQTQLYSHQPQILQPVPFHQGPQIAYNQDQVPHPYYNQDQPIQVIGNRAQLQPGLLYGRQQVANGLGQHQQAQRELKTQQNKGFEKQTLLQIQQQGYDKQQQQNGAVSYASFSQGQPSNYVQQPQPGPQHNYVQPSIQYAPAKVAQPVQTSVNSLPTLQKSQPQVVYPQQQNYQPYQSQADLIPAPQVYQQPIYPQGQGILVQNPGYPQPLPVAPTFAPVQYFGKFAQNIFGGYQQ